MLWWCGQAGERDFFFTHPTHPELTCTAYCNFSAQTSVEQNSYNICREKLNFSNATFPSAKSLLTALQLNPCFRVGRWRASIRQSHEAWSRKYTCPFHVPHSRHSVWILLIYSALKTVLYIFSLPSVGPPLLTSYRQPVYLTALKRNTFVCFRFAGQPHRFWLNAAGRASALLTVAFHWRAKGPYRTSLFCPFRIGEIRQQTSVLTGVVCQR